MATGAYMQPSGSFNATSAYYPQQMSYGQQSAYAQQPCYAQASYSQPASPSPYGYSGTAQVQAAQAYSQAQTTAYQTTTPRAGSFQATAGYTAAPRAGSFTAPAYSSYASYPAPVPTVQAAAPYQQVTSYDSTPQRTASFQATYAAVAPRTASFTAASYAQPPRTASFTTYQQTPGTAYPQAYAGAYNTQGGNYNGFGGQQQTYAGNYPTGLANPAYPSVASFAVAAPAPQSFVANPGYASLASGTGMNGSFAMPQFQFYPEANKDANVKPAYGGQRQDPNQQMMGSGGSAPPASTAPAKTQHAPAPPPPPLPNDSGNYDRHRPPPKPKLAKKQKKKGCC
eukprot:TRINITY_DN495_c0_g1_i1.p1 TRINITY_DN495_c0_g1~~TRINITY_DN495_c0_g1_i1.p1  ORF type:complete len:340 (-),score=40.16 TRINITY_DN495_c0_g1_i1:222-1241(-)